jgi:uncharacterized protein with PIN domain
VTVALDATALLARHLEHADQAVVAAALAADADWCASALALTEALALVDRVTDDPGDRGRLRRALRADWERIAVVPVDQACLDRAVEIAAEHPVGTVHALHLAAADRLPRPVRFVTFDDHQIPAALALGFDVVSS